MTEGFLNQVDVHGKLYDLAPTCDDELDENSVNAVQNKVITEALNNITNISTYEIDDLFDILPERPIKPFDDEDDND